MKPVYLAYGDESGASAYVCLLSIGIDKLRMGLVQCGPVLLEDGNGDPESALKSLTEWANKGGFVFLRFTHSDTQLLSGLTSAGRTEEIEPFPFYRDPRNKLMVTLFDDDERTLTSFQKVARYEIRAASRIGYEIRVSERPEHLEEVWPMFLRLAKRKGFRLSARPLPAWLDALRMARLHGCSRMYSAYLEGRLVESILVIRYGATAEYVLGALDVGQLKGSVSPSCLIHWQAMRDFHRLGCRYYNLGGPGDMKRNLVLQFKKKFHPVLQVNPPPVTLVLRPGLYRLWSAAVLQTYIPWRSRVRRLISHLQPQTQH